MQRVKLVVLVSLLACSKSAPPPPGEPPPAPKPAPPAVYGGIGSGSAEPEYRTPASTYHVDPSVTGTGKSFMVASESAQASAVGAQIMADGGNAIDATVATALALAVVHPSAGNIGGGGFAVVHGAGSDAALDFRETAPTGASRDMYVDASGKLSDDRLVGHRASGVPGAVAGLYELHKKYGKKPWKDVVAPALALARDGFHLDPGQHEGLVRRADCLKKFPATRALWFPGDQARATGDTVKIPELAAVLARIAEQGADGFYKGETAKLIVDEMKQGSGLITADDLASYKAIWRAPLPSKYRGYTFVTMPPPSSGGIVLALTSNMLHGIDLGGLGWHSAEHVHWIVEVWRRAFAARNEMLGDPAYVLDMPVDRLMSQAYADGLAASIGPRATPSSAVTSLVDGTHTTNVSVVDKDGVAVAMTTTLNEGFGSCVTVAGAGFLMNDEMDDFTTKPGSPNLFGLVQGTRNAIEPGKRMLSSMSPTIVIDDHGKVFLVLGAGGGPRIITAVWQTLSNVIDFKMSLDAAVAAPRFHHQHLPDTVRVQGDAIDRKAADALAAMGYKLEFSKVPFEFAGITAIVRTDTGWAGTADPRRGGGAVGDK